jgi:hypothetical protein
MEIRLGDAAKELKFTPLPSSDSPGIYDMTPKALLQLFEYHQRCIVVLKSSNLIGSLPNVLDPTS